MQKTEVPQDGKVNDKVHTDIKPQFKERPAKYPATRTAATSVGAFKEKSKRR